MTGVGYAISKFAWLGCKISECLRFLALPLLSASSFGGMPQPPVFPGGYFLMNLGSAQRVDFCCI
jgi:hypothetical protein